MNFSDIREYAKLSEVHPFASLVLASVGSVYAFSLVRRWSVAGFVARAPHDGQDALGAILCGLAASVLVWIAIFGIVRFVIRYWAIAVAVRE